MNFESRHLAQRISTCCIYILHCFQCNRIDCPRINFGKASHSSVEATEKAWRWRSAPMKFRNSSWVSLWIKRRPAIGSLRTTDVLKSSSRASPNLKVIPRQSQQSDHARGILTPNRHYRIENHLAIRKGLQDETAPPAGHRSQGRQWYPTTYWHYCWDRWR